MTRDNPNPFAPTAWSDHICYLLSQFPEASTTEGINDRSRFHAGTIDASFHVYHLKDDPAPKISVSLQSGASTLYVDMSARNARAMAARLLECADILEAYEDDRAQRGIAAGDQSGDLSLSIMELVSAPAPLGAA